MQQLEESVSSLSTDTPSQGVGDSQKTVICSEYEPVQGSSSDCSDAPPAKRQRGTKDICTPKVVAALDRSKISSRNAVFLLAAILEAVDLNVEDYQISKSAIHDKRNSIRKMKFDEIKKEFNAQDLSNVIVHWDGKIVSDISGDGKVDRLPIVLSYKDISKLLCVSKLDSGTGKAQAEAVFDALQEWAVSDCVIGLCCDTTASNLGYRNGAAVILETLLDRFLLYFPCRHHTFELVLRGVFEVLIPGTTGPEVPIFVRFQKNWSQIDVKKFRPGILDPVVMEVLKDKLESIESNIRYNLTLNLARDDYKELLCLSLLFIGIEPYENYSIKKPGAMHHARWMSKAIYSLKIFLFRNEFDVSKGNLSALRQICIFIVKIYIKFWFVCDQPEKAPRNDLNFLKDCHDFKSINKSVSQTALKKILNHLWYFNPQNVAMAFFDSDVSIDEKRRMILKLNVPYDEDEDDEKKKVFVHISDVPNVCEQGIEQFVSSKTKDFFKKISLSTDWLKNDPANWEADPEYQRGRRIVKSIKVVNDVAERNVQLFENYNGHLTKNEDQMQYIVHIAEAHRKKFSSVNKEDLAQSF